MKAIEAKQLLEQVPEDDFTASVFTNGSKCCAVGHLTRLTSEDPEDYSTDNCNGRSDRAMKLSITTLAYNTVPVVMDKTLDTLGNWLNLAEINNHQSDFFPQESSKERVLAALDILIKEGH